MIRHRLVYLVAACVMGFATYKVKYGVQDLAQNLVRVQQQTVAATEKIRDLRAEWAYLTQPRRLARLNDDLLKLQPITTAQLMAPVADIPFRPLPGAEPGAAGLLADAGLVADAGLGAGARNGSAAGRVPAPAVAESGRGPVPRLEPELVAATAPGTMQPAATPSGATGPRPIRLARAAPSLDALFAEVAGSR